MTKSHFEVKSTFCPIILNFYLIIMTFHLLFPFYELFLLKQLSFLQNSNQINFFTLSSPSKQDTQQIKQHQLCYNLL